MGGQGEGRRSGGTEEERVREKGGRVWGRSIERVKMRTSG